MKNSIKIILLHFVIIFSFITSISAQAPDTLWTKTFGGTNIDIGHFVEETFDGGFIITGYTRSFGAMSGRNVWLIKTDASGNEVWNNTFGGNDDDEGYSVKQTADSGYIITGYTKSFGSGLNDVYLIKTDAAGNEIWSKTFGGAQDDEGYSIVITPDGGFVAAGVTSSFAVGGRDVWLIKTDGAGNELWNETFGGLSSDGAWFVQNTFDKGFILTGWTFSQGPGFLGSVFLVKTDSSGNEEWNKYFGGSDADRGYCVQPIADSGYIIAGYTGSSGAGLYDMYLVKTDQIGNEEWSRTFGGTGRDYGYSVDETSDGGFIITGYTLSFGAGGDDLWVVKTDANGNEEWSNTYGGSSSDIGYSIKQTSDGGLIITGHTLSFGAGVHDVWLIKTDNIIPVELVSFNAEVNNNNVTLSWMTSTETNNSGFEIERQEGSRQSSMGNWKLIGFVPGVGTTTEPRSYNYTDAKVEPGEYIYRLKQIDFDGTFIYTKEIRVEIAVQIDYKLEQNYPNPFNPTTTINFSIPEKGNVTLKVFDVLGNEIITLIDEDLPAGEYEVEFSAKGGSASGGNASSHIGLSGIDGLPSGIYFYKLEAGKFSKSKKMILMK